MKVTQVGAFVATVASLSTIAYGFSFSDVSATKEDKQESTDLTTNEENRIYGGSEANIDKYPFLVSLRDPLFDENFCGGALVAPQYILTAGHCIKTDEMTIIATFGTNDSSGTDTDSGDAVALQVPIIKGFRHPLYKKKQHLYDVGLLKLKKPVKRKTAKLCAADGSDNKVGTMATVLGWGKTEYSNGLASPILEQLTIPVISNAECGKFKKYVGRVTEGMLCAGTGNGKDTCNGDSGGPLIVDDDILIGCVSWGSKCGQQAGIYTRLAYVMDYIQDILAGGDGSKFNVTSSSSGSSMDEVSLPSSDDSSKAEEDSASGSAEETPAAKGGKDDSTSGSNEPLHVDSSSGSDDMTWLIDLLKSGKAKDLDWLFASESDSGSEDPTLAMGKTVVKSATDSESGSDDLSWLLDSDSDSGSDDVLVKGKTPATKGKTPIYDDSESGSDDLSWLLDSDSDSGSDDVLVKGKTPATKGKTPIYDDSESGSDDLSWLLDSDSNSGSEDTVLVKGGSKTPATKGKTPIYDYESESASNEDDVLVKGGNKSPATKSSKSSKSTKTGTETSSIGDLYEDGSEGVIGDESEKDDPILVKGATKSGKKTPVVEDDASDEGDHLQYQQTSVDEKTATKSSKTTLV